MRSSPPVDAAQAKQGASSGQEAAAKSKSRRSGVPSDSDRYPTDCQTRGDVAEVSEGRAGGATVVERG